MYQTSHEKEIMLGRSEGDTQVSMRNGIFTYTIPDTDLAHGTSLGNARAWAASKGTGAIQSLFSTEVGVEVTGSLAIGFFSPYRDLLMYGRDEEAGRKIGADTIVRVAQSGVGRFNIHPAYQEHSYELIDRIYVRGEYRALRGRPDRPHRPRISRYHSSRVWQRR